jgi:tripartite-type tricarboxylate transporter receptor subunit TctC
MKKKISKIKLLGSALLSLALITGCSSSTNSAGEKEQPDYPTKPIEITTPSAAGGGVDLFSRAVADYLGKEWGQTITVVNKPGAAGVTGTQSVIKQGTTDGYSIMAHSVSTVSALMAGNPNLPFNVDDFKFIGTVTGDPLAWVVKADAPWNNMIEFGEWVKENPDKLTFATSGPTAVSTFGVVDWLDNIGGDFSKARLIVTGGAADSIPKVAGGHIVLSVQDLGAVSTMVKSGKLKILGVTGSERSDYFPDVPTLEEQGITGVTTRFWAGLSVPSATPDYVVEKWESSMEKMMEDPEFQEKLKSINSTGNFTNAADLTQQVRDEIAKFSEIAKKYDLIK